MKRASSEMAISADHPAVAFHREVLTVQQWAAIRQAFLAELQDTGRHGVTWQEPGKLWRHSQEALGKWILSQIARVGVAATGGATSHVPASESGGFDAGEAQLRFFPSAADFAAFTPRPGAYDEQLIRDLSLKSVGGESDPAVVEKLVALVTDFALARRCDAARAAVETQLAEDLSRAGGALAGGEGRAHGGTGWDALACPRLRRLEASDPSRTPAQRRVHGPLAELSVVWPTHWERLRCRHCAPVSIPWAAYEKLRRSYEHHNGPAARAGTEPWPHYDEHSGREDRLMPLTAAEAFLYRAATVMLRYEGGLATGSLQLCADTALKQHLHYRGYHVMDLCASPINAYMGVPAAGQFRAPAGASAAGASANPDGPARTSSLEVEEVPNFFCSAFLDTDRYFGSLGSALRVDPIAMGQSRYVNPAQRPLLLTLDVPYDEDLCELLFQKLVRDMARAEAEPPGAVRVDYVLVLPLWWSIPMRVDKHLFSGDTRVDDEGQARTGAGADERAAAVLRVVQERSAMLKKGYQVRYTWPEDLAAAAGDGRQPSEPGKKEAWICFDSLFVGDSGYAYFCTATNRWLQGVTATEVIGLAQPGGKAHTADRALLATSLKEYYQ